MQFGAAIGTACGAFAATNIDDIFVLVTFFAESATNNRMSPLNITIGQYVGFTAITIISMIGFGISLALPSEPIGFLGFLPMLLGWWGLIDLLLGRYFDGDDGDDDDGDGDGDAGELQMTHATRMRIILKVATITLINGGDNIGTYIPLFSQTRGAEIAVYVVVFYILVGVWCLAAWLVMKQRHVLLLAQRYAEKLIPFLYMGLGVFVLVKSHCYPWSIERIDHDLPGHPGRLILALCTTGFLLVAIGVLFWIQWRSKTKERRAAAAAAATAGGSDGAELENVPVVAATTTTTTSVTEMRQQQNRNSSSNDGFSSVPEKPTTADTSLASTIATDDEQRQIPPPQHPPP